MHELGLMTGVVDAAVEAAREAGATRLLGVKASGSAGSKQASPAFRRLRRRGLRPGLPPAPTRPTQKSRPGASTPGRVLSL